MLSSTPNPHKPLPFPTTNKPFSSTFLNPNPFLLSLHKPSPTKPISATLNQLYQPFRPPPSPLPPKFRNLDTSGKLEILADRLGLWHEYAPLIPSLTQDGFTPASIEESTGIPSAEQNRLVVAAQVRDSLIHSNTDQDIVSQFDSGGSELLYEIRLLSAAQRAAAARYIIENELDVRGAQDLARAIKDYPRRRGEKGWDSFDYSLPGDCLSFMLYRQSREHREPSEQRRSALKTALDVAVSEKAREVIMRELEGGGDGKEEIKQVAAERVKVPVVRMKIGEVAEASSVVVLPVCDEKERERGVLEAPFERTTEGEFGVVVAEKGWGKWVVLPGWEPVAAVAKGGVVVAFDDARVLPWKVNRWYKEEAILVVADRERREVGAEDGFYLVANDGGGDGRSGGLKVERGSVLKGKGVEESLGTVVLVVRPPKEEIEDQLSDEDWE